MASNKLVKKQKSDYNLIMNLSQRDPRWANIKLGTSNTTIGNFGCTITAIASILGTTPDVVNDRMKAVNGFASGNLVIWAKISEAFPGTQVHRVWSYNNDDVAANVPNVIVEVDGKPIGGARHWLRYLGNQKAMDPWDGKTKATSTYPNPLSYCIIKPPAAPPKNEDPMVCDPKSVRDMLVDKATKFDEFVREGFETVKKIRDIIEGHQSRAKTLENQLTEAGTMIRVAEQKQKNAEDTLSNERQECQKRESALNTTISELKKERPDTQAIINSYEGQLKVERESKEALQKKLDKALIDNAKIKDPSKMSLIERFLFVFNL